MGLPDPRAKNDYGTITERKTEVNVRRNYSASGILTNEVITPFESLVRSSRRGGFSQNKWELLPGTITPWREPSSYSRSILRSQGIQPIVYTYRTRPAPSAWTEHTKFVDFGSYSNKMEDMSARGWWDRSSPVCSVDENLRSRVETECLLKLKDQKAMLSETLATARQTGNLLAESAGRLWGALLAVKRRDLGRARRLLGLHRRKLTVGKGTAGEVLKYQYGWKPLMSEIEGLYELFGEQIQEAQIIWARRNLRSDYSREYKQPGYDFNFSGRRHSSCTLVGQVRSNRIRTASRVGLANPLQLGWELIPLSFVVDWSIPVGNVLSAMDATSGIDFVGGYFSDTAQGFTSVKHFLTGSDSREVLVQTGLAEDFRFSNRRIKYTNFPSGSFYAKSPFSTDHVVNALALFRMLF